MEEVRCITVAVAVASSKCGGNYLPSGFLPA